MDSKLIEALPHQAAVPLLPCTIDPDTMADSIEQKIKHMISSKRRAVSLSTHFDESLSYSLSPALQAYEMERLTALHIGQEEVQQCIKNGVPAGHSFKGYPQMFHTCDTEAILSDIESRAVPSDIISTVGDRVAFAVRVKVKCYAEKVVSVWVMIACRFRPMLKGH
jgi:hypothetical protein